MSSYRAIVILVIFTVIHVGVCDFTRILGMKVVKDGFLKSGTERSDNAGLTVHLDEYTNQNRDCLKVMRIEQSVPWKLVDELMVSCESAGWRVINTMVSYGKIVHIQTRKNRAAWAVFDLGDKCLQRTYSDKEDQQLAKTESVLTREECDGVLQTQAVVTNPSSSYAVEPQGTYSALAHEDSAVLAMDGDVSGYDLKSTSRINSGAVTLDVTYYHKDSECVRLVTIYFHQKEVQNLKISCGPANARYVKGNFQFGKAFTVKPAAMNSGFKVLYNLPGEECLQKVYMVIGTPIGFSQSEEATSDKECSDLREGKDALNTAVGGQTGDLNWVRDSMVGGGTATPDYTSDSPGDGEEDNTDDDPKDGEPSDAPAQVSGHQSINKLKVLALNGVTKGYKAGGSQDDNNDGTVRVQSENYYKPDGECVKLVTIKVHDAVAQLLKATCASSSSRQVNGHYQMGAAFTFRPEPGSADYKGLFNFNDQFCVKFVYTVVKGEPTQITRSKGVKTKSKECKNLMRGKNLVSSGDLVNTNTISPLDSPPTSDKISVLMMNGDTTGYTAVDSPRSIGTDNILVIESQEFRQNNGECVTLVNIKVHEVLAQQLKMTCVPYSSRGVSGRYQYGSAFTISPASEADTYAGLFNVKNEFCFKITYTYVHGDPPTITKAIVMSPKTNDCKDLMEGKDLIGPDVTASGSTTSDVTEGNADTQATHPGSTNTPPPSPTGIQTADKHTDVTEGNTDTQATHPGSTNTPPPSPTGSQQADKQTGDTGKTHTPAAYPGSTSILPPSPTESKITVKQRVLAMDSTVDGKPVGPPNKHINVGPLLMISQDLQRADGKCVKVVVISIDEAVAQRFQMVPCGPLYGKEEKGHYQYGTAFTFRPESGTDNFKGMYNFRNEHCFKVTYKVNKGNPTTVEKSPDIPTNELACKFLMEGKDLLSEDVKTLIANAAEKKQCNKCVVVGWFQGFFTRLYQALFGRFFPKQKAEQDCCVL